MKKVITATLLGGAIVAGPLLLGTGTANASCASVNGHRVGQGCESTPGSTSIGLGRDAKATADGPGNLAVAVGNPGHNPFYGQRVPTLAYAGGTNNVSLAFGDGSNAGTLGHGNSALVVGNGSNAFSYGGSRVPSPSSLSDYLPSRSNTSVTLGHRSEAGSVGPKHKLSTAFGNDKRAQNNGLKPATPSN